ncbi:MAG TPA: dephospho-CoA kinase, partial [Thermomicrobiales bacterium]|nr:dephospho-CoA kinase [Thermomicrobiales bacterium]
MVQSEERKPFVLGVTGNIACGKSTIMQMLSDLGAETIDADKVYHRLIEPDRPLWQSLIDHFGADILMPDGEIDRRKLGGVVFRDAAALQELERITHPAIRRAVLERIAESTASVVAIDAIKLIEGGFDQFCDQVWLVTCLPDAQRNRLMRRNGLSEVEADQRIAAQPPLEPKIARADLIIDNSGSLESTTCQVHRAWDHLP